MKGYIKILLVLVTAGWMLRLIIAGDFLVIYGMTWGFFMAAILDLTQKDD